MKLALINQTTHRNVDTLLEDIDVKIMLSKLCILLAV